MVAVIPLPQAVYCANPDAVASCWKLCPAADTVSIGVRLGCYLQAIAFFVLVLVAPDEGGAESMWLGLSVSFCFVATNYIMLWLHMITMHHTVVVILLSHLPYVATMAGLNSLTSYEVLGPAGVRFLQSGLILKAISTALLWALCIWGYAAGKLPDWLFFQFRQINCLEETKLVLWFVPVSKLDGMGKGDIALLVSYSLFWFLVLCAGSYWSLIAPIILVKRGGHLRDPKKKKIRGFPIDKHRLAEDRRRRRHMKDDPADYTPESDDDMLQLVMRSVPKNGKSSRPASTSAPASSVPLPPSNASDDSLNSPAPSYTTTPAPASTVPSTSRKHRHRTIAGASDSDLEQQSKELQSANEGLTYVSAWSKGVRGSAQDAHARWTRRQIESRHHFIVWPICAVLMTFVIVSIELQMAMNDVFRGAEEGLDFPGVLSFFLALPTAWAVAKALRRIQEGRRPTPMEREDKTFLEIASGEAERLRQEKRRRREKGKGSARSFSMGHDRARRREVIVSSGESSAEEYRSNREKRRDGRGYGRVEESDTSRSEGRRR